MRRASLRQSTGRQPRTEEPPQHEQNNRRLSASASQLHDSSDQDWSIWMQAAGEANKLGEPAQSTGLQLRFHNHDFEFHKSDGELIYDKLMGGFDPAAVKMQFQVEVVRLGYRAADYFEKYSGWFISIHLSDWSAADADGKELPLGQGVVDWRKTFTAAKAGGVKNYFLEMDPANMKASLAYLRGLS